MKFAENNRVSHRQFYRQIILSFSAPFLLCLFQERQNMGLDALAGIVVACVIMGFYTILLFRAAPCYVNLKKTTGRLITFLITLFFFSYIITTSAFLLTVLGQIVKRNLIMNIPEQLLTLLAILVCSEGIHKGMQKRGRMAEVSGGVFLVSIIIMLLLCISQMRLEYLKDMLATQSISWDGFGKTAYVFFCAFSGINLIPYVLEDVEKNASAGKLVVSAITALSVLLVVLELIFPGVLGWERLLYEEYPVLPLLAGADFPGNVLARFDILWLGIILYGMLFSIGSLLHYGRCILRKSGVKTGFRWIGLLVWVVSFLNIKGYDIKEFYGYYLCYFFVPVVVLLQILLLWIGIGRKRKKSAAVIAMLCFLFLSGCAGIEPENRMYPLAMGVDLNENITISYGTADLSKATGQEKPQEQEESALSISGESFEEIQEIYDTTQEKYLDLGHLQVLVLGNSVINQQLWKSLMEELKKNPYIGEDIYVFRGGNAKDIINWKSTDGSSVGEYLAGIIENRTKKKPVITLRDIYKEMYHSGYLIEIPEIIIQGQQLQLNK